MARKKTSDGNDSLKIVDLPKRKPKIVTSDEWTEILQMAMKMALHAAQVETLVLQAEKARKFSDDLVADFYHAKTLCDAQRQIFIEQLKKILG